MPPQQQMATITDDVAELHITENAASTKASELLLSLGSASRKEAATHIAQHIKEHGVPSFVQFSVAAALESAMKQAGKTGGEAREGACLCVVALCKEIGAPAVPFVLPLLPMIIELMGDKVRPVQLAANDAGDAIVDSLSPNTVRVAMPYLLAKNTRWQSNLFRMEAIAKLVNLAPLQIQRCMGDLVPALSETMWDLKPEVKVAAKAAMEAACNAVDNR